MVQEVRSGFQEYGVFSESDGIVDPLGTVAFDPIEELIWTGSQTVRRTTDDNCIIYPNERSFQGQARTPKVGRQKKRKSPDYALAVSLMHLFPNV